MLLVLESWKSNQKNSLEEIMIFMLWMPKCHGNDEEYYKISTIRHQYAIYRSPRYLKKLKLAAWTSGPIARSQKCLSNWLFFFFSNWLLIWYRHQGFLKLHQVFLYCAAKAENYLVEQKDPSSVVPGPAAPTSPGSLRETPISAFHTSPAE